MGISAFAILCMDTMSRSNMSKMLDIGFRTGGIIACSFVESVD